MLWVIEDLGRPAALDDLAAVEHDGLVGELTAISEVIHGTCGRVVHKPVDSCRDMRITSRLLWMKCGRRKNQK
jgi:hypothetical protein